MCASAGPERRNMELEFHAYVQLQGASGSSTRYAAEVSTGDACIRIVPANEIERILRVGANNSANPFRDCDALRDRDSLALLREATDPVQSSRGVSKLEV